MLKPSIRYRLQRVQTLYLALGLNLQGKKELLGIWIAQTEAAKFWLSILTELQNRGVKDKLDRPTAKSARAGAITGRIYRPYLLIHLRYER